MSRRRQRGATYLTVMIGVAIVSAALASTAEVVSRALQRERERQLLWVGEQFRRAIISYARFPAGIETYPKTLEQLVDDRRRPVPLRHLRRVYHDPMTASTDWGLILNPQQRIIGVYSKSTQKPIKLAGFPKHYADFENAERYADWRFGVGTVKEAEPAKPAAAASGTPSAAPAASAAQPR